MNFCRALVVAGNSADPADSAVRAILAGFAQSDDLQLRDHARWAIERLDARSSS